MLPQYGGYGNGKRGMAFGSGGRGGGAGGNPAQLVALAVLALLTTFFAYGHFSNHRKAATLKAEAARLQTSLAHSEDQLTQLRSVYQHMEYEFHTSQRRVNDMTRELQQKDHVIQQHAQEKDACTTNEVQLNDAVKELQEQIQYEQALANAYKGKIADLEKAHAAREADWQALSQSWSKFEQDANKENARLLAELQKAGQGQGGSASPTPQAAHLPHVEVEPKVRPESTFDAHVTQLPKEDEYVHHHGAAQYLRQLRERQAAREAAVAREAAAGGVAASHTPDPIPEGGLGAQDSDKAHAGAQPVVRPGVQAHGMQGHHPQQQQQQQQHAPPSPVDHAHHTQQYDDPWAHEHHWDDPNMWADEQHLDPLDHYWIHDGLPQDNNHQQQQHQQHHDNSRMAWKSDPVQQHQVDPTPSSSSGGYQQGSAGSINGHHATATGGQQQHQQQQVNAGGQHQQAGQAYQQQQHGQQGSPNLLPRHGQGPVHENRRW